MSVSSRSANAVLAEAIRTLLSPLDSPTTEAWCDEVMLNLRDVLGADCAGFTIGTADHAVSYGQNLEGAAIEAYDREFHLLDFGYLRRPRLGLSVWTTGMLWDREELLGSRYWHEYKVPFRLYDALGMTAEREGRMRAELFFHRDDPAQRFGDHALELADLLLPALRAAVDSLEYTSDTRQRFVDLSDSVSDGVLVYDFNGRLLHRNRAAAALLEQNGCSSLLDEAARCAQSLAEHYRTPLGTFRYGGASSLSATTRAGGGHYRLTATAAERSGFCSGVAAIVTVVRASPLENTNDLRERFQLTDREATVVGLLTQGRSNTEVAVALGISPHTARHHTQRVLEKLGVRSRAEVPRLLLGVHDAEVAPSVVRD